jgi:hypothetical protein
VYSAVQQVGSVVQVVEPVIIQASTSGDSIRYIIMVRAPRDADINVKQIVVTVATAEAMQTYQDASLWHPIGSDVQNPIFWNVRIPLYQVDDPTIPGDLIIGQNQRFLVEMTSADAVPCTVERTAPAGMSPGSWHEV